MDEYFNEYLNLRANIDNYNMTDNSYSDNRRMTDLEVDAYYEDYMERTGKPSDQFLKNNPKSAFAPEGSIAPDLVNSPDHYTHNGIEAINVIEAKLTDEQYQGYLQGSVMKYLLRSNYKGKRNEDLKKAQWYLNKLVENQS